MIRIAVTGTGMLVNEIMPMLSKMPEIDIVAIVGTKRSEEKVEALKKQYSIPESFTDFDEMLATKKGQVDLVYLATPNNSHYEMAKKSIEAGYNTFIEKPLVETVEEAETVFEMGEKKGLFVLEAISNQYLPAFDALKKNLSLAGQIKYASLNFSQYSSRYDRFMAGEYFKVFDAKAGGGALKDLGVYNIHLAAGLFGMPKKINYFPNITREVDTSGVMIMDYGDFKLTSVAAKDCQGDSGLMIEGTEGYFKLSAGANALDSPLIFHDRKSGEETVIAERSKTHRMQPEFAAVEKMIRENDKSQLKERQLESITALKILRYQ